MASDDPSPEAAAPFSEVLAQEWEDIRERRAFHRIKQAPDDGSPPKDLKGIALSGGGIRSATFCLGVLQYLNLKKLLPQFDYLSTVSGGGFIGGWWSAWLARKGQSGLFPPTEGLETARGKWESPASPAGLPNTERPEGSRCAGTDPVHHLRLFANYLTPRKGALSGDTWRAIAVVFRNLLLTVVMLVPLLAAAIFASQFYFTAATDLVAPYTCDAASERGVALAKNGASRRLIDTIGRTIVPVCQGFPKAEGAAHRKVLLQRADWVARPLLVLVGAWLMSLVFWMLFSVGRLSLAVIAAVGVAAMLWFLRDVLRPSAPSLWLAEFSYVKLTMAAGALVTAIIAGIVLRNARRARRTKPAESTALNPAERLTNRMTRLQSILLVSFAVGGVVLVFGGFAHELVEYTLFDNGQQGAIPRKVAEAVGWLAVIWAGLGALFTGVKAAPTGGGDQNHQPPGRISQLIFAVTPVLVLIVLLTLAATLTHTILSRLYVFPAGTFNPLIAAFFIALGICCLFAVYEFRTDADAVKDDNLRVTWVSVIFGVVVFLVALTVYPLKVHRSRSSTLIGLAAGVLLAAWYPRIRQFFHSAPSSADVATPLHQRLGPLVVCVLLAAAVSYAMGHIKVDGMPDCKDCHGSRSVAALALGGIAFAAAFVGLGVRRAKRVNHRVLALLSFVVVLLGPMLMQQHLDITTMRVAVPMAIIALVGILVGGIIGLGWMMDPNYLSLHTFYRARLVRAYMGASNLLRRNSGAEISDSADGDDVPMAQLTGSEKGGPYHLINATLNLVGGRDLTTAQRSAAYYTMSRRYCGSLRTGYRPTEEYMGGQLSLGTAVAVSGAAASPNMGSKTPSAALAMLMALLNVRLGFWAPTPNQSRWKSERPRLWPFYLIREFLSQTNDLSLYCYLTDGGHFDNTGLYSLVQRGCRHIVLVDCGADPDPCFSDLGDAIRRCRIDFRADIRLEVENFRREEEKGKTESTKSHYVIGKIIYSKTHAEALGWTELTSEARTGTIVWIKPSLLHRDPAEVRQYGLENKVFPQQSTADQWFDEAQFESYRRLGETCAAGALTDEALKGAYSR